METRNNTRPDTQKQKQSEAAIQAQFHIWLWNTYPETRGLCWHTPNGGKREKIEAARLKAQGVVAGVPDYFCAIPRQQLDDRPWPVGPSPAKWYHGLFIEFKEPGANMNTDHVKKQKAIQDGLRLQNYRVEICSSFEQAVQVFKEYYNG
jgi:hypothetical protein